MNLRVLHKYFNTAANNSDECVREYEDEDAAEPLKFSDLLVFLLVLICPPMMNQRIFLFSCALTQAMMIGAGQQVAMIRKTIKRKRSVKESFFSDLKATIINIYSRRKETQSTHTSSRMHKR